MAKKLAIGRGLDSLIPKNTTQEALKSVNDSDVIHQLLHSKVTPSPLQPRAIFTPEQLAELVDSIKEHGIIQPLIVRKNKDEYELIAGERRWRAASILQLERVPAIIREASDQDVLELALIENIQRESLSPIEEARAYKRLKAEFKMKQADIARRVGKSRAAIANSVRLLDLPELVQENLISGNISVGHAKVLLSVRDDEKIIKLTKEILGKNLTVRQLEKAVQKMLRPVEEPVSKKATQSVYPEFAEAINRRLNTSVQICGSNTKGTIEISYSSPEKLEEIIAILGI